MSFFTCAGLARYALRKGHLRLWKLALGSADPRLAPAEQLANAAASRKSGTYEAVYVMYEDLIQPAWIADAFYRSVESDNRELLEKLYTQMLALQNDIDGDRLLVCMARHGAAKCWLYAVTTMGLRSSVASHDALVDAALQGGNGHILVSLQHTTSLAAVYRNRISSKRELDNQVRGGNPQYIHNVLLNTQGLKSCDYGEALAFALQKPNHGLCNTIYRLMDEADIRWNIHAAQEVRPASTSNIHVLRRAA